MKPLKHKILGALLGAMVVAATACASVTVEAPACYSNTIDFGMLPPIPANTLPDTMVAVSLPPQSISYDFSSDLGKVGDVVNELTAQVTELTLTDTTGDLSWVRSILVQIDGSASDGSTPTATLASGSWKTAPGGEMDLSVSMDSTTLYHYMQAGSITITFTLSGEVSSSTVSNTTDLSNGVTMCILASGSFSKKF